jgi:palmitoyltransferase
MKLWGKGINGIWMVFLTLVMIFFVSLTVFNILIPWIREKMILAIFGYGLLILLQALACWSFLISSFSNPGIGTAENIEGARCGKCGIRRDISSHHCSKCKVCVSGMDHHCIWINNCVGSGNRKTYALFLGYTASYCVVSIIIIVWCKLYCYKRIDEYCIEQGVYFAEFSKLLSIGLCLFFLVFLIYLAVELFESISTGRAGIDRLKFGNVKDHEKIAFSKVMRGFSLAWLIPYNCSTHVIPLKVNE